MNSNLSIIKDSFKELPNNIEAEQAVLGSILVSNEIFDEINTIISKGKNVYFGKDKFHFKFMNERFDIALKEGNLTTIDVALGNGN